MSHSDNTYLMHAVLDGAATAGEEIALEQLLAVDPEARAEYDDLSHVFNALQDIPKAMPPEGLVSAVMANIPQRPSRFAGLRQLFMKPRVISTSTIETPGAIPGKSATVHPIMQRGPHHKGENKMSEQTNSSLGNRKIWIGAGVAAAAVIVAVSTGILPPSGKDTSGTIAPAQRYVAPQGTAADVKLDGTAGTQSSAILPAVQDAAGSAAKSAADNAAMSAAYGAAKSAADSA
ncbi:MAG: hypothetical protein ABI607_12415, partial [Betaproteobacteria bacterium]